MQSTLVGFDANARPVPAGEGRMFIGVRSDPFFADAEGAFHDFQWTGPDTFANKDVLSIAIEAPNDLLLAAGSEIAASAKVIYEVAAEVDVQPFRLRPLSWLPRGARISRAGRASRLPASWLDSWRANGGED
jgi:hypothetical protein